MVIVNTSSVDMDVYDAKNGDKEAISRLIHENKLSMYRIARSILKKPHDVEDAIGDTILIAFEKIGSLRKNASFKMWLLKILINQCNGMFRKKNKEFLVNELEFSAGIYDDTYENFELMQAINSLEENQRITTILFYYEDMSLKDIANILGIPEGTVKSRLNRAKEKLKKLITK